MQEVKKSLNQDLRADSLWGMNSRKIESNPGYFPGSRCLRALASSSGVKGPEMTSSSDVGPRGVARGHNYPGAESLWGLQITTGPPNDCGWRRKVLTMPHVHSSMQQVSLRKISGSNMGTPNLLLAPCAI